MPEPLYEHLLAVISNQANHFTIENKDMMFIGQQLVYLGGGYNSIAINMSDYLINTGPQTTESPGKGSLQLVYLGGGYNSIAINMSDYLINTGPQTIESPGNRKIMWNEKYEY